ncbi:hypothetical protein V5F41_03570 [Xanthobacter autotrophicus]|uniref:hypothetical protein n=1 Tax=Xanthobacter autotrophicus TaxID=280 RepID=UPI00372C6FE5
MNDPRMPPINFTLTENARRGIEEIRKIYIANYPDEPTEFPSVCFAIYRLDNGIMFENVMVSFYQKGEAAEKMRPFLQRVGDIDLIYFVDEEGHRKLEGAIIDYRTGEGFFLRDPVSGAENRLPDDVIEEIRKLRENSEKSEAAEIKPSADNDNG